MGADSTFIFKSVIGFYLGYWLVDQLKLEEKIKTDHQQWLTVMVNDEVLSQRQMTKTVASRLF